MQVDFASRSIGLQIFCNAGCILFDLLFNLNGGPFLMKCRVSTERVSETIIPVAANT
jgi:hypothetical protein